MRTISLKLYLILLIVLIAILCLLFTSGYVLYEANKQSQLQTTKTLDAIARQLHVQLIRISTNFDRPENFPDLNLWREADKYSGQCVHFAGLQPGHERRVCSGASEEGKWPDIFETIYRRFFEPSNSVHKQIEYAGKSYGVLRVKSSANVTLYNAWKSVRKLMGLSILTVTSLSLLLYIALDHALQPSRVVINGLDQMTDDDFTTRLPNFFITEWQHTGQAINQLASELQSTLQERKALALKLVNIQEEERRFLARELHDEFGQSLAGLSAIGSLIVQLADKECQILAQQGEKVSRVTAHMMTLLQEMLLHLRPSDFDELGLVESLKNMVAAWNAQSGGKTHYDLKIYGDFSNLPDTVPVNIFRIVQECLTNIAKHSSASKALVRLARFKSSKKNKAVDNISIHIEDDGVASNLDFISDSSGIGILGIHERVKVFDGKVKIQTLKPNGLVIDIEIPFLTTRD